MSSWTNQGADEDDIRRSSPVADDGPSSPLLNLSPTHSHVSSQDSYASGPMGEVAVDTVERLGQRIMAIILGNLCTLAICLLFYLNYVLFESYLLVFLYAFLASEALWDTKQSLVSWLRTMSDRDATHAISIREEITNRFLTVNNNANATKKRASFVEKSAQTWVLVGVYGIGLATYPLLCIYLTVFAFFGILLAYALDDKILFVFRLHRWFLDDDTFIALVLIIFLLFAGVFVASSFTLLVLRDVRTTADLLQQSLEENLFGAEWAQNTMQQLSLQGKNIMHDYVDVLEDEYLKNSTWGPILRWTISYADNLTESFKESPVGVGTMNSQLMSFNGTSWWIVPSFDLPDMKELFGQAKAFFSSNQELLERVGDVSSHVKENVFAVFAMGFSVVFILVDFGVRIVFFITILFILLSSKETVLHEFLSGFMENEYDDPSTSRLLLFEMQLRSVIEAVLMLPIKMSLLNALATLLLFWMFGLQLMFFAASLNLLITIFPIITPFWVCLPWIVVYYVNNIWTLGWSILVFSVNYTMFYLVNMWVLAGFGNKFHRTNTNANGGVYNSFSSQDEFDLDTSESDIKDDSDSFNEMLLVGKREYITGLSVFFGLTAFGAKGALLGPVVVCLALVMYNVIRDQQQHVYRDSYQNNITTSSVTPSSQPLQRGKQRNFSRSPQQLSRTLSSGDISRQINTKDRRRRSYHGGINIEDSNNAMSCEQLDHIDENSDGDSTVEEVAESTIPDEDRNLDVGRSDPKVISDVGYKSTNADEFPKKAPTLGKVGRATWSGSARVVSQSQIYPIPSPRNRSKKVAGNQNLTPRLQRSNSTIQELAKSSVNLLETYFSTAMSPGLTSHRKELSSSNLSETNLHNQKHKAIYNPVEDDIKRRLRYLKHLLKEELITEANYEQEKQALLSEYKESSKSFSGTLKKRLTGESPRSRLNSRVSSFGNLNLLQN